MENFILFLCTTLSASVFSILILIPIDSQLSILVQNFAVSNDYFQPQPNTNYFVSFGKRTLEIPNTDQFCHY